MFDSNSTSIELDGKTYSFWNFESDKSLCGFILNENVAPGYGTFMLISAHNLKGVDRLVTPINLKVFTLLEESGVGLNDYVEIEYLGNGGRHPHKEDFKLTVHNTVDIADGVYTVQKEITYTL